MTTSENESTWSQWDFFSRNILAVYDSDYGLYAAFTMYIITHEFNNILMFAGSVLTEIVLHWPMMAVFIFYDG